MGQRRLLLGGGAALILVSSYLVARAWGAFDAPDLGASEQSLASRSATLDGQPTPWSGAEGGAFQDMIEGVDSLRTVHTVSQIPEPWLGGPYLSEAGAFPEIRTYWQNYLRFVDEVRSQDTILFRRSFVSRLAEQDLSGPMISIRLAQALENFKRTQPSRDTVYVRMADLASSALDLHDLLVERASEILYDPVSDTTHSRQPILEAWSENEDLRASIWTVLDRITANLALLQLDAINDDSDLTERLFQELRARSIGDEDEEE